MMMMTVCHSLCQIEYNYFLVSHYGCHLLQKKKYTTDFQQQLDTVTKSVLVCVLYHAVLVIQTQFGFTVGQVRTRS